MARASAASVLFVCTNGFYDRKKSRTNRVLATKALAHKLARACYYMLRDQKPFDAHLCFG